MQLRFDAGQSPALNEAVRQRLAPDGVFVQWLQAYEIDTPSVLTVYATVAAVFDSVESWRTKDADLLLVSSTAPRPLAVEQLRSRVAEEPYRTALMAVWRAASAEGSGPRACSRPRRLTPSISSIER